MRYYRGRGKRPAKAYRRFWDHRDWSGAKLNLLFANPVRAAFRVRFSGLISINWLPTSGIVSGLQSIDMHDLFLGLTIMDFVIKR